MKKKILIAFLLMFTVLFGVKTTKVFAGNGPSDVYSFIIFYDPDAQDASGEKAIYEPNTVHNDIIEGVTYDKASNTLTLDNVKTNLRLSVNEMGEDFKINLVGENEIPYIIIYGFGYGGNVEFTGNGSLIVNKDKSIETGMVMAAEGTVGRITVDNTATLKVYGSKQAILIGYSSEADNSKVFILKNGQDISNNIKTDKQISKVPQQIYALIFNDGGSTNYMVATKNGRKYAVSRLSGGDYVVQNNSLAYLEVDDIYFLDPTSNPNGGGINQQYASLEELEAAGYTMTDEQITVNYWVNYGPRPLGEDTKGVKYVMERYYIDSTTYEYKVYDITNKKIILYDGNEYTVATINNDVDGNTLTEITEDLDEGYNHVVELTDLEVYPSETNVKEVVKADDNKSDNDKAAAGAVNELLAAALDGQSITGMSDALIVVITEAIENGDSVTVELETTELEDKNVSDEVKKSVEDKIKNDDILKDAKVLGYFDINLLVKVNDDTLDEKVTELNKEIEVKVDVSELVKKLDKVASNKVRKYYVIRIHDGKTDVIEATLNDDNTLSFKTDRFSSYTVTYKDVDAPSNPKTLDNINTYIILGVVSLISLIGIALFLKKRKN